MARLRRKVDRLLASSVGSDGLVITCDGEPDEALTELAGEGLRPVQRLLNA